MKTSDHKDECDWQYITDNGGPTVADVVAEAKKGVVPRTFHIVNNDSVFECRVMAVTSDSCDLDWIKFSHKRDPLA